MIAHLPTSNKDRPIEADQPAAGIANSTDQVSLGDFSEAGALWIKLRVADDNQCIPLHIRGRRGTGNIMDLVWYTEMVQVGLDGMLKFPVAWAG